MTRRSIPLIACLLALVILAGRGGRERGEGPGLRDFPVVGDAHPSPPSRAVAGPDAVGEVLALDRVAEVRPDGAVRYHRLEPPATRDTLATRLREMPSGSQWRPVVQGLGLPGQRLVTRDLTVRLQDPGVLPRLPPGLVWKDRPVYAPELAVISAPDPLAAWEAVDALRQLPGIAMAQVQLAEMRYLRSMPSDPLVASQWHLQAQGQLGVVSGSDLHVEPAWAIGGVQGAGVRIGIVDDGLQLDHPDLAANVDSAGHWDWNGDDSDPTPAPGNVHGTPCGGIAAAVAGNGVGGCGVAPLATLVGMRLIAAPVTDAQEAAALTFRADEIQVKSNSWGPGDGGFSLGGPGPLARAALAHAAATGRDGRGTIFVWAAGNGQESMDNANYDGFANDIHTIAVAATDSLLRQAYYSEPGANVVVAAPSDGRFSAGIVTTDLTGNPGYHPGDYCDDFGGTSAAAPAVAGVVALMLEKNPELGWRDVQEILIRTARRINPSDPGWSVNGAGLAFNPKFGAGLVDAAAAVELAAEWENLPPAAMLARTYPGAPVTIPEHPSTGAEIHFTIAPENLRCEQVQLTFSSSHTRRGDLEIQLVSPSGTFSPLAARHNSSTSPYSGWTFSSVHHWGEEAAGTWTLRVTDKRAGVSGTLTAATLTLHGTALPPVNPAPSVAITSPQSGASFGVAQVVDVEVSATDLNADGSPGTVAEVALYDHGVLLEEKSSPPFHFQLTPGFGTLLLTAVATDAEGRQATSLPVSIAVVNQAPIIQSAVLSPAGPTALAEDGVAVTAVTASDPDLDPLEIRYRWERSDDGVRWESSGGESAALPGAVVHAGWLWRCRVTATDGSSSSPDFIAGPINLLRGPPAVASGSGFHWRPGMVLPGCVLPFQRQAVLHELSQGSQPGTGWVELLTLKAGALAGWSITGSGGAVLTFSSAALWQDLPAGTLVVIHRGGAGDPLLPPAELNPAAGRVVVAHDQAGLFTGTWPDWGLGQGSLVLADAAGTTVAALSHGQPGPPLPSLPALEAGSSIYYGHRSEPGVEMPDTWVLTTAAQARAARAPRALGDPYFSEYVEGTGDNRALEIYNPGASSVDLSGGNYRIEIHTNGSAAVSLSFALTGTIPAGGVYVVRNPASTAIPAQQVSSSLNFNGNDAIVLKKAGVVIDAIGRVGENPGTAWVSGGVSTADATLRRKPEVTTGRLTPNAAFDPAIEWTAHPVDDFSGLGWHGLGLTLAVQPAVVSETAGSLAATGTITLATPAAEPRVVTVTSSMPAVATVPATVTIPPGALQAGFTVGVVDDPLVNGTRSVSLQATAAGAGGAQATLLVTDDESPLDGVTPGAGNTPENLAWISDIRSGLPDRSATVRVIGGSPLPAGLSLDAQSGIISGTVTAPPGDYPVTLEIHHATGQSAAHDFIITISPPTGYAAWIIQQAVGDAAPDADPDGDGYANLLEYALAGNAGVASAGLGPAVQVIEGDLVLEWWQRTDADDVDVTVEWSATLAADSWQMLEAPPEILPTAEPGRIRLRARVPGGGRVFARLRVVLAE